jgi:hypothetical protein
MEYTKKLIELLKKHNEVAENLCFAISEPAGCTACPYYDENTEECEVEALQNETERAIGEKEPDDIHINKIESDIVIAWDLCQYEVRAYIHKHEYVILYETTDRKAADKINKYLEDNKDTDFYDRYTIDEIRELCEKIGASK